MIIIRNPQNSIVGNNQGPLFSYTFTGIPGTDLSSSRRPCKAKKQPKSTRKKIPILEPGAQGIIGLLLLRFRV